MSEHKNSNEAVGNYCIYAIYINFKTFKIGKANLDELTAEGVPVRIDQQIKLLGLALAFSEVESRLLIRLYRVTTRKAKEVEKQVLQEHYNRTGEVPPGNQSSFKPE